MSLSLRDLLTYYKLPTISTKLVTLKPCNYFQLVISTTVSVQILLSITSNFSFVFITFIILLVATATMVGLPPSWTVL